MSGDRYRFYQQAFPDGDYSFVQLAFVVDDAVRAARRWSEAHGVGPFFVLPDAGPSTVRHRGVSTELETRLAVSQAGPLQIELIEERSDGPSVFRDLLGRGGTGAHHLCTMVRDYDRAIDHYTGLGYEVAADLHTPGLGRVAYVDTGDELGLMTEIVEWSAVFMTMLSRTAQVCASWDGSDPVRRIRPTGGYDVL